VVQRGSNTILLDAYNANPSSMTAAVANFAKAPAPKKVIILGDMFELGADSAEEHRKLGVLAAGAGFDLVVLCGSEMAAAAGLHPDFCYFPDKGALQTWLAAHPVADSHILIKGSRGMGLESLLDVL
jgi:UDP-N-acetylmuramoyl-tripeptide--D-alanyl-D-alanine ligase